MLKLLNRILLASAAAVEQFFFHPRPHTLTPCVVMASSASAVHALDDTISAERFSVKLACILLPAIRVDDCSPESGVKLTGTFNRPCT